MSLLFLTPGLSAQGGKNPFELPGRTTPTEQTASDSQDHSPVATQNPFELKTDTTNNLSDTKITIGSDNPFEIKKNTPSPLKKEAIKPSKKIVTSTFKPLSRTFKLWMTILLVTVLTLLVNVYKSVLGKVYRSFLNDNFLKMVHRDYGTVTMIPYLILYSFSLIVIGLFLFVVLNYYEISFFPSAILNLLTCIGGVLTIFLLKHLILQLLGSVFPISKEIDQYSFTIIIFGISLGIFLLPAVLLISYAPPDLTIYLIYGTFIVISLIYLYRILRSLFIGIRYISLHKFHFFVYLCTIEIAPLLILMKIITVV